MTGRYAHPVSSRWDQMSLIRTWVRYENAILHALGLDYHTPDDADLGLIMVRSQQREVEFGHDIAAFAAVYGDWQRQNGHEQAAKMVHYSLCSSDLVDYGIWYAIRETTNTLLDESSALLLALNERISATDCETYRLARTHGQAAVPITYKHQLGVWWTRVNLARNMLMDARRSLFVAMSATGPRGPVGDVVGYTLWSRADRASILSNLGLDGNRVLQADVNSHGQAVSRTYHAAWVQAVAALVDSCEHIAMQVRLGAQTGVGELAEPTGAEAYRGSSSMPHKRNPTRSERICGIAAVVRGLAAGYQQVAASWWGEHSLEHSSADRIVLPQVSTLGAYVLAETCAIVTDLEVDWGRVEANLVGTTNSYLFRNLAMREGTDSDAAWLAAKDRG